MIFFDVRLDNQRNSTVSIRKMSPIKTGEGGVWAYEITTTGQRARHRGTVSYEGPEGFALIAAVLNDYVGYHRAKEGSTA